MLKKLGFSLVLSVFIFSCVSSVCAQEIDWTQVNFDNFTYRFVPFAQKNIFTQGESPRKIAVDEDGNIYAFSTGKVTKYKNITDATIELPTEDPNVVNWEFDWDTSAILTNPISDASDFALDSEGSLWVIDNFRDLYKVEIEIGESGDEYAVSTPYGALRDLLDAPGFSSLGYTFAIDRATNKFYLADELYVYKMSYPQSPGDYAREARWNIETNFGGANKNYMIALRNYMIITDGDNLRLIDCQTGALLNQVDQENNGGVAVDKLGFVYAALGSGGKNLTAMRFNPAANFTRSDKAIEEVDSRINCIAASGQEGRVIFYVTSWYPTKLQISRLYMEPISK